MKNDERITYIEKKKEHEEGRNMANNILIKGLKEEKQEKCVEIVSAFFKDVVKVPSEVGIKDAFRIGKGENRVMLVKLKSTQDKEKIYKHTSNLKGVKNFVNKPYKILDQLPARDAAECARHQDILWENRQKENSQDHINMSLKKGTLTVGSTTYRSKPLVRAPTAKDVLKAPVADQIRWRKVKCIAGSVIKKDKCWFQGFSVVTGRMETIRDAYLKLREEHSDSMHIMCGYRLPGKNTPFLQDSVDDNEGGAHILRMLKQANIYNRAVFVKRHYGGTHLGPTRFQAIVEAAQSAVVHDPYNHISKCNQTPWPATQNPQNTLTIQNTNMAEEPLEADPGGRQPSGPIKPASYLHNKHKAPEDDWNEYYQRNFARHANQNWEAQVAEQGTSEKVANIVGQIAELTENVQSKS